MDRRFDRIVSVGMFEHVGVVHYHAFFDTLFRCLGRDGVALLHSIGQWDGPRTNNPWISGWNRNGGGAMTHLKAEPIAAAADRRGGGAMTHLKAEPIAAAADRRGGRAKLGALRPRARNAATTWPCSCCSTSRSPTRPSPTARDGWRRLPRGNGRSVMVPTGTQCWRRTRAAASSRRPMRRTSWHCAGGAQHACALAAERRRERRHGRRQ